MYTPELIENLERRKELYLKLFPWVLPKLNTENKLMHCSLLGEEWKEL